MKRELSRQSGSYYPDVQSVYRTDRRRAAKSKEDYEIYVPLSETKKRNGSLRLTPEVFFSLIPLFFMAASTALFILALGANGIAAPEKLSIYARASVVLGTIGIVMWGWICLSLTGAKSPHPIRRFVAYFGVLFLLGLITTLIMIHIAGYTDKAFWDTTFISLMTGLFVCIIPCGE